ncbi:MAG TPA: hypothetical protein VE089_09955 [Nitrososphaeraceae archaeon]|nr:hypothetical protein [Nitrososphaeraceae archaeon]
MSASNSNKEDSTAAKIVYFGVININENGRTIGAVDIWRNVITKELFCEEKRLGILEIADYIGMPKIAKNQRWAVAISRKKTGKNRWKLLKLIEEGKFKFVSPDDEENSSCGSEVTVEGYNIVDREWWSFLVEKNINRTVEVEKRETPKHDWK